MIDGYIEAARTSPAMGYINPLLKLPAAQAMVSLAAPDRLALACLMTDLRRQANDEAERAWKRRKGPMACYWRAVSTYARHIAHLLMKISVTTPLARAAEPDMCCMRRELDAARGQVADLIQAAAASLPPLWHPEVSTPENWARRLRAFADGRTTH